MPKKRLFDMTDKQIRREASKLGPEAFVNTYLSIQEEEQCIEMLERVVEILEKYNKPQKAEEIRTIFMKALKEELPLVGRFLLD